MCVYLGKGGAPSLRLDGDGLGAALEDLVYVLFAELGPLILLVHDGPVGPLTQQVLDLLLGQLLPRLGREAGGYEWEHGPLHCRMGKGIHRLKRL